MNAGGSLATQTVLVDGYISATSYYMNIIDGKPTELTRYIRKHAKQTPCKQDYNLSHERIYMYRLYTEVQVSMLFTQPRAEGPRLCKLRRDRTEVYNGLVPWAMWP